jgi:hypothetical protein
MSYDNVLPGVFAYVITAPRQMILPLLAELTRTDIEFGDDSRVLPWGTSFAVTAVLPEETGSLIPGRDPEEASRVLQASPWLVDMEHGARLWLSSASMSYLKSRPVNAALLAAAAHL